MKYSIIIPSLNSLRINEVLAALESQLATHDLAETIVVGRDDAGLISNFHVHFEETSHPISAAEARNKGAKIAKGKWLVFLDADCIPTTNFVHNLNAAIETCGPVFGGAIQFEPSPYWTACDNISSFQNAFSTSPSGTRPYLPSFLFVIEKQMFVRANGFDEKFTGAAGEDLDLSFRLRKMGVSLDYVPRLSIFHRPARDSARQTWQHLHRFGRTYKILVAEHPEFTKSRYGNLAKLLGPALLPLAPFAALLDTVANPIWKHEHKASAKFALGMMFARIAWYVGRLT